MRRASVMHSNRDELVDNCLDWCMNKIKLIIRLLSFFSELFWILITLPRALFLFIVSPFDSYYHNAILSIFRRTDSKIESQMLDSWYIQSKKVSIVQITIKVSLGMRQPYRFVCKNKKRIEKKKLVDSLCEVRNLTGAINQHRWRNTHFVSCGGVLFLSTYHHIQSKHLRIVFVLCRDSFHWRFFLYIFFHSFRHWDWIHIR